jgi:hypothetical protein
MRSYVSPAKRRLAGLGAAAALLLAIAGTALGTSYINLTTAGATGSDTNGGIWLQGTAGAGTGNFDPFLTAQTTPSETAVNVCDDPGCPDEYFDTTGQSSGRTHELLASAIPVVTDPAGHTGEYREFSLDSNDTGNDDWVSVDEVEIYLSTDKNLGDYPFEGLTPIYELPDDVVVLLRSQTLSSGSGQSDLTLLVPNSAFPADCFYGSTTCDDYVFFYTKMGYAGNVTISSGTHDFSTNAGFEEWRVSLQPVVNVTKTANVSLTRSWPWTIQKSATETSVDLFAGQTGTIHWSVTAAAGTAVDSNVTVSGNITVTNPTGGTVIKKSIPAEIASVTDLLTQAALDTSLSVSCPVTFPYTLAAGATLNCTYTGTPPNTTNGTNTATATLNIRDKQGNIINTLEYSGTAAVNFGAATVSQVDECIVVTDDNATPGVPGDDTVLDESLCANESPGVYNFQTSVGPYTGAACTSTTITNTAHFETVDDANDTTQNGSANASVPINCYQLGVSKTAQPALTRSYDWTILKTVNPTSLNLFNGDSSSVTWTITVTRTGPTDSGWGVTGTITVSNPAPMQATGVSVSDMLTGSIAGTVDCDAGTAGNQTTVTVPAKSGATNGTASCSYSATLPNGDTRTNTATATLFSQNYTGTASVNFANAIVTEIDESANVADGSTSHGPITGNASYSFNETFACGESRTESNTATVTVVDDANDTGETHNSTANVDVNCYGLTVQKNATTTFDRNYNWDISKTRVIVQGETDGDNLPATLELQPNQPYTATYQVAVGPDAVTAYQDSNWAVSGTITIQNPAPIPATGVSVSDLITKSGAADIAATVDCDAGTAGNQNTVNVPAKSGATNGSATCSYSASLPDGTARTNTATATLFSQPYTGSANVTFGSPTTLIDECVNVTDDLGGTLGQVCVGTAPQTFTYTLVIGPYAACGVYQFPNTATYLAVDDANDTGETASSTYTVTITVPCPEGCTLTQGYWKTHNDSFHGGAPTDETWSELMYWQQVSGTWTLLGPGDETSPFFLSGQSYFNVMWTAPKGNAYYNLAHQYIGAQLNMLAGADPTAAQTAFDAATVLFKQYTPGDIAGLKGKAGNALRAQFISLAGTLGSYNEGLIGPGHCDEDGTSSAVVLPPLLPIRRRRLTA